MTDNFWLMTPFTMMKELLCVFSTSILDTLIVLRRNQWMEGDMNDFLALVPFDYEATAVRLCAGCLGTILSIWWSSLLLLSLWIYTIHHFHCLTVVWCSFCLLPLLTHPPLSDIYKKTLHFPHLKSPDIFLSSLLILIFSRGVMIFILISMRSILTSTC